MHMAHSMHAILIGCSNIAPPPSRNFFFSFLVTLRNPLNRVIRTDSGKLEILSELLLSD